MDSIWINEIYKTHRTTFVEILKQEISNVHCVEKFEELAEKKEIFRKAINLVRQNEYNLATNGDFLAISVTNPNFATGALFLPEF